MKTEINELIHLSPKLIVRDNAQTISNFFKFLKEKENREYPLAAKFEYFPNEVKEEEFEKFNLISHPFVLIYNPQFIKKFSTQQLNNISNENIKMILKYHPNLKKYFPNYYDDTHSIDEEVKKIKYLIGILNEDDLNDYYHAEPGASPENDEYELGEGKLIHHKWNKTDDQRKLKHYKCERCKAEKWRDPGFGKLIYQDRFGKTHYRAPECTAPNTRL
jgi:hypothetical protein